MHHDTSDDTIITGGSPGLPGGVVHEPDLDDTIIVGLPLASSAPESALRGPESAEGRQHGPPGIPTPPTATPGPALHYRLRINGTIVSLDKVAYIGRKPSAPRVMQGGVPRLIQVQSALREVSGTHIEIRQRGASVVITDLRSTNGSVINIPGRAPRKLCRGESVVVMAGTLVDIGDGNLVEILPMQRA
ncbi:FHA domain-containing protein [Glaciihabitans tibetensis]|uniref:FHA domain-containing protein n=1 Tax=Glaciihabitans tibetensis TaxID=1266600 RepID=A0A2T0VHF8_9MICO|nr:FHA domain-containing protein [Glaciihabitans tibetensis]PRY69615.1 FHA domain-containing protein [Glaciihabitans tibetensis]